MNDTDLAANYALALSALNELKKDLIEIKKDTERLRFVVERFNDYCFAALPEDLGRAREYIDSLIDHGKQTN